MFLLLFFCGGHAVAAAIADDVSVSVFSSLSLSLFATVYFYVDDCIPQPRMTALKFTKWSIQCTRCFCERNTNLQPLIFDVCRIQEWSHSSMWPGFLDHFNNMQENQRTISFYVYLLNHFVHAPLFQCNLQHFQPVFFQRTNNLDKMN